MTSRSLQAAITMLALILSAATQSVALAQSNELPANDQHAAIYRSFLIKWRGPVNLANRTITTTDRIAVMMVEKSFLDECAAGAPFSELDDFRSFRRSIDPTIGQSPNVRLVNRIDQLQEIYENEQRLRTSATPDETHEARSQILDLELMSFSNVAISDDGQMAMFEWYTECGSFCGSGQAVVFDRDGDDWVQRDQPCMHAFGRPYDGGKQ